MNPAAWNWYEQLAKWARKFIHDEDDARNIALATLERYDFTQDRPEQEHAHRLHRALRWRCLSHLRSREDAPLALVGEPTDGGQTPEEVVALSSERRRIHGIVGDDAMFALEASAEFGDDAVALAMGRTPAAVRQIKARARAKLKGHKCATGV